MGRRPVQNKKSPADYPQFAFRVTKGNKEHLNTKIEEIQKEMNRRRKEDDPFINKNDVILIALEKGLKLLAKGKKGF
jgi:phosphopantothenate synthetase